MILQFIKFRIYNSTHVCFLLGVKLLIHFSYTWWFTNDMSTTHCGANIVRIRVGLSNDILRFVYALRPFLFFVTYYYGLTAQRLALRTIETCNTQEKQQYDWTALQNPERSKSPPANCSTASIIMFNCRPLYNLWNFLIFLN